MMLLIALSTGICACAPFAKYAADRVYPNLQTFLDTEAPPTPGSYPASSAITAVIGGRGEGISCSLPPLLEAAMFGDLQPNEAKVSLQFRQACAYHDYCYRHGHATYGYTQNDCDFALQQSAYRLCRMIIKPDGKTGPADCLSRARRILLGVTLGGGKAFRFKAYSTYYEFDPMPDKADDYVAVRWVDSANAADVRGLRMRGDFEVMYFKRGTVQRSTAQFDPEQRAKSAVAIFPDRFIATPPHVVNIDGEDHLLGIARDNFQNTEVKIVEYWPVKAGARTDVIGEHFPQNVDKDASVFWFPQGRPELLDYWSDKGRRPFGPLFGAPGLEAAAGMAPATARGAEDAFSHDRYRTLQHMPLDGRFFAAECDESIVLKRGGASAGADADSGDDYQQHVHLAAVRPHQLKCFLEKRTTLAAKEEAEPLTALRLPDGRDVIISLTAASKAAENNSSPPVRLAVFDLAMAKEGTSLAPANQQLAAPLDASWLAQPPQVLFDKETASSLLFFSRYLGADPGNVAAPAPHEAIYEFAYFRPRREGAGPIDMRLIGQGACRIDLDAQARLVLSLDAEGKIRSSLGVSVDRSYKLPSPGAGMSQDQRAAAAALGAAEEAERNGAMRAVLNERWANAQVIPGWFLKRSDDGEQRGPLDVAVFFRGYAQYALLLAGTDGAATGRRSGFRAVTTRYADCTIKAP